MLQVVRFTRLGMVQSKPVTWVNFESALTTMPKNIFNAVWGCVRAMTPDSEIERERQQWIERREVEKSPEFWALSRVAGEISEMDARIACRRAFGWWGLSLLRR